MSVRSPQDVLAIPLILETLTILEYGLSLSAIDLLTAYEVAGGISKVDEACFCMEIQCPGVHEIFYGDHVLIRDLGTHVHASDDTRPALPIHQEQLMLWFCKGRENK